MLVKAKSTVLAGIAAAAILLSCSGRSSTTHAQSFPTGQNSTQRHMAPDFTLADADGNAVKLSDLHGKVVLLNFWATWCGPCSLEIPWFVDFEQQYRARGLEVVGVSMDEDGWKVVKPYIKEHRINYRILMGNDSVGQLYGGVDSLPTTFIIDQGGHVAYTHVGLASKNEYLDELQKLLAAPGANTSHADLHRGDPALLASAAAEAQSR